MKLHSRVILLLLILQADVTGFFIWLSFASSVAQNTFALLLCIDLIALATVTNVYRIERMQTQPNKIWIILGCLVIAAAFFSSTIFV